MKANINFTKNRFLFLIISIVIIVGFWSVTMIQGGFNYGIDFRSGLNIQAAIDSSDAGEITAVKAVAEPMEFSVRNVGNTDLPTYIFSRQIDEDSGTLQQEIQNALTSALEGSFGAGNVEVLSVEFVGPSFAAALSNQTIILIFFALVLILLYIWIRFRLNYAVAAILALVHDVLFLLGFMGTFGLEFTTASIAAVLTIIGYSLNDTIVIFDRIRENETSEETKTFTFREKIDLSINQSLSRTIITSVTTFIAVLAIFLFTSGTIRLFALNLMIGVVVGTYSSIFIASTTVLAWHNANEKKAHKALMKKKKASAPKPVAVKAAKSAVQEELPKLSAEEIKAATAEKQKAKEKKKKKKKRKA